MADLKKLADELSKLTVLEAAELTETAILEAIRLGHFYASQGPAIEDWRVEGTHTHVRCSPATRIQLQAPNGSGQVIHAPAGQTITEATYTFAKAPKYLRVTCVDAQGKRAWTNPIMNGA